MSYTARQIVLAVLVLGSAQLAAKPTRLTVNGKDLRSIIKPGEVLVFNNPTSSHLAFSFNVGSMQVGALELAQDVLGKVRSCYKHLQDNLSGGFSSRNLTLSSPKISYKGSNLSATEKMVLGCEGANVLLHSSLLTSPEISLVGKNFDFVDCFITKPETVLIESANSDTLFQGILITFDKEASVPAMLYGDIDLETGAMSKTFIAFGAKEIEILFHEDALK